jgi:hypothetical protein
VAVITATPATVETVAAQEVKNLGADFAIITESSQPNTMVDLKTVAKLPATTPVNLNQYNVMAYKKIIRDVTVYPSFTGINPSGVSEIDYGVSRKITNDGKYLGIVVGYDFDNRKVKAGLRITY